MNCGKRDFTPCVIQSSVLWLLQSTADAFIFQSCKCGHFYRNCDIFYLERIAFRMLWDLNGEKISILRKQTGREGEGERFEIKIKILIRHLLNTHSASGHCITLHRKRNWINLFHNIHTSLHLINYLPSMWWVSYTQQYTCRAHWVYQSIRLSLDLRQLMFNQSLRHRNRADLSIIN